MKAAKPSLVIMAAGLGRRYGGLKQVAPVDESGHIIIDYSIYDACRAGFENIICVIAESMQKDFTEHFKATAPNLNIEYVYQRLDNLPGGHKVPLGRKKPWGTAHAVLSAKDHIKGHFAAINADDFYGAEAFKLIFDFLETQCEKHAMVGYPIENTLTENGSVSRGICNVNENQLLHIQEIIDIFPAEGGAKYTENGTDFTYLPSGTIASMNMWGFRHSALHELEEYFKNFLAKADNPLECECFLPTFVGALLQEKKAEVMVLPTSEKWYGITYVDDMQRVSEAIGTMRKNGIYPDFN